MCACVYVHMCISRIAYVSIHTNMAMCESACVRTSYSTSSISTCDERDKESKHKQQQRARE